MTSLSLAIILHSPYAAFVMVGGSLSDKTEVRMQRGEILFTDSRLDFVVDFHAETFSQPDI